MNPKQYFFEQKNICPHCRFCTTIQLYVNTSVGTVPVPWNLSFANTNYLGQTGYWNMQQVRKWRMFQYFVRMAVSFIIEFNLDAIRGVSLGERILGLVHPQN